MSVYFEPKAHIWTAECAVEHCDSIVHGNAKFFSSMESFMFCVITEAGWKRVGASEMVCCDCNEKLSTAEMHEALAAAISRVSTGDFSLRSK